MRLRHSRTAGRKHWFRRVGVVQLIVMVVALYGHVPPGLALPLAGTGATADLLYPGQKFVVGANPSEVAVADVNGDGALDLVAANNLSFDVSVLLGRGDGTLGRQQRFAVGNGPQSVAGADLNGDGAPDLVTANFFSDDVSILLGQGDGTFEGQQRFAVGLAPSSVAVADLNGDGLPDVVTANSLFGDVSVLLHR